MEKKKFDLIIIGGGPAGMAAAIYAERQRINILLVTKSFGGQVARKAVAIENYPGFKRISGEGLIGKFKSQIEEKKIEAKSGYVSKVSKRGSEFKVSCKSGDSFFSKAVIVASGADPRPLEVPGEKKFIGKGVSYCVACDGPLYSGKKVALIGGGNSAFEASIALSKFAEKIYILENSFKAKADVFNQEKVEKTGKVEIIKGAVLKKIEGKESVESVKYQDRKSKKIVSILVEGVFIEIGSQPATSFAKGLVDFNEKDEIKINPADNQTKTRGLFASGDATNVKWKQIVIAAGEGAKAALSACDYLQKFNNGKE